jgi:ribosomal protein S27E
MKANKSSQGFGYCISCGKKGVYFSRVEKRINCRYCGWSKKASSSRDIER